MALGAAERKQWRGKAQGCITRVRPSWWLLLPSRTVVCVSPFRDQGNYKLFKVAEKQNEVASEKVNGKEIPKKKERKSSFSSRALTHANFSSIKK